MKGKFLANCEKNFLLKALKENKRLDGRALNEFRKLEITFGTDYGCCTVSLGETKVLCQVSCEMDVPSATRPNEGLLFINVEYGIMASGNEDTNKTNQLAVQVNRFLEKCIKESRCLDLEALCIISEEKVWIIRIYISVLNNDGNLLTCCSVAAITALAHFRTPLVTFEETEVVIHSPKVKPPVPLSLLHFPVAIKYVLFEGGSSVIVDPTELEEKVAEAELVFGLNRYRELCALHFSGKAIMTKQLLLSYTNETATYAADIVDNIKVLLEEDNKKRVEEMGEGNGLIDHIKMDRVLAASQDRNSLRLTLEDFKLELEDQMSEEESSEEESENEEETNVSGISETTGEATIPPVCVYGKEWTPSGGENTWLAENESEESSEPPSSDDDVEVVGTITDADRIVDNIELSGDSEEETTATLRGSDIV